MKRKRLADYRLRINEVMSVKKLSDIDQSEMLRHYSDEKMHRRSKSTPSNESRLIDSPLLSICSALRNDDEKKAISVLSIIRSSDSYMLQKINEMYITDENKIILHLWTKPGEFST